MALLNVIVNEQPQVSRLPSPIAMLMAVSSADAATGDDAPTPGTPYRLTADNAAAVLGPVAKRGRRWYEALEAHSDFALSAVVFDPSDDATKSKALTDVTGDPDKLDVLGEVDAVVWPDKMSMTATLAGALAAACHNLGANAIVDTNYDAAKGPAQGAPEKGSTAQARAWRNAVLQLGMLPASNGAPYNGVDDENGAIVLAAHIARWAGIEGIGAHPFSFRHPVLGAGTPSPKRTFSDSDNSAAAVELADLQLTSIIRDGGATYLWGGEMRSNVEGSALVYWGNRVVANRMRKRGRQIIRPYVIFRLDPSVLDTVVVEVERALLAEFGQWVVDVSGGTAALVGRTIRVRTSATFHGFSRAVELIIDAF